MGAPALALDGGRIGGHISPPLQIMTAPASPGSAPKPLGRSPFAGCLILVAAVGMLCFLVGFSIFVLFRQYAEIEKIIDDAPVARAVPAVDEHEAELVALAETLEAFRQQLGGKEPARLELTPGQINLAVAAYAPLRELRGTFEVLAIGEDAMDVAIAFPLNGKPRLAREGESGWITSDTRHLNALMRVRPVLMQREIVLQILSIEPASGAAVPDEFVELMSPYRITERYLEDPVLGPAMAALTRVETAEGVLALVREPGENPADFIPDSEVDAGARRFFLFFGVGASLFLTFAGIVIFIGLRSAKNRAGGA